MANYSQWQDHYWLMLMEVYLRKPTGIKPLYSRPIVDLALELHIPPQSLLRRMGQIARLETPRIERIWRTYSAQPQRLERAVRLLRKMNGFGMADEFYDGVELQETFEKDFRPIAEEARLTPVMLIILLDLYYKLTPPTMVKETPEVRQTARRLRIDATLIVEVLEVYKHCDPCLGRHDLIISQLLIPCMSIWRRFSAKEPQEVEAIANDLKEYFK